MTDLLSRLYFFGRPFGPLYGLLMRLRSHMYTRDLWKRERMGVPVISVGNLTMGGSGKTPIVRFIADLLAKNQFRPAIISRGYGGKARDTINIVSDTKTIHLDAVSAGDEPFLLAESLPGIPVLTGVMRLLPCRFAVERLGCNILILDDGFQHLRVIRDIDLVLFNAAKPVGNNRIFPAGEMREPLSALSRAHAFLMTGMSEDLRCQVEEYFGMLQKKFPGTPRFFSSYVPLECRDTMDSAPIPIDRLQSSVYGFCGIAHPERFLETLTKCGLRIKGFTPLEDHQGYDQHLLDKLCRLAEGQGAEALITTEKDMVKLRPLSSRLPLYALIMSVEIDTSFSAFLLHRLALWKKPNGAKSHDIELPI